MAPMQNFHITIRSFRSFFLIAFLTASLLGVQVASAQLQTMTTNSSALRLQPVTEEEKSDFPTLQKVDPSVIEAMQAALAEDEEIDEEDIKDVMEEVPQGQQDEVLEEIKELLKQREQLALERELREAEEEALAEDQANDLGGWLSEYWVQFWALVAGLLSVILAVSGFSLASRKKRKSIAHFINEIDTTFDSFKSKSKRCEAELYRLQDVIDEKLKKGKIDESTYHLLEARIDKYMKEVEEVHDPIHDEAKKKRKN